MLAPLEFREEERGMTEIEKVFIRVLRRLPARGHLAVSHRDALTPGLWSRVPRLVIRTSGRVMAEGKTESSVV